MKFARSDKLPSISKICKIIGCPIDVWPGNCSAIAYSFIEHKIVKGKYQYGLYGGDIAPGNQFSERIVTHHAWILMPDGRVCDPTRWVFESVEPYIYFGPNDSKIYDMGGNEFARSTLRPCPDFDKNDTIVVLELSTKAAKHLKQLDEKLGKKLSLSQLFWLGNLPPDMLYPFAKEIYQAMVDIGRGAILKIDNRREILGE